MQLPPRGMGRFRRDTYPLVGGRQQAPFIRQQAFELRPEVVGIGHVIPDIADGDAGPCGSPRPSSPRVIHADMAAMGQAEFIPVYCAATSFASGRNGQYAD